MRARASRPPAPPAPGQHAEVLPAAVSYVLDGAASLIADDGDTASAGLLESGAEAACATYGLPGHAAPAVFRRAAFYLARASGYQPLDPGDPVIDRALDELAALPARTPDQAAQLRRPPRRPPGSRPPLTRRHSPPPALPPRPGRRDEERGAIPMATATPPGQAREGPATAAQSGLIRGLYADRAVPWPARTSREAFLMERATAGSGQFLTEPDAGQVTGWLLTLARRVTPAGHPDPPGEVPDMTPTALHARLTSRGYIPVSHGATDYPENWLDLDGPAGSVRVVTHPGDGERVEVYGLGPGPAGLVFEVHMPGGTPEAVTVAMLNAAEAWLSGRLMTPAIQRAADGLPPGGSRPATAPPREDMP